MKQDHQFDVLIVGGGPAGMSAAIWCAKLGLRALLLEKGKELGGQLLRIFGEISDYPGLIANDGRELRDRFAAQCTIDRVFDAEIASLASEEPELQTIDGRVFSARAIVIATGVRRRQLGVPGEAEFAGRGILDSGVISRQMVAGKRVVIIGGGDAALENAVILSETAERVFVVHRRSEFSAREEFVTRAQQSNNVEFISDSVVTEIIGDERVSGVCVRNNSTGEEQTIETDAVLIRIGVEPNSEIFRDVFDLDEAGYVRVNERCETSVRGIYAVGDVASPGSATIATAVGMGATAAKNIYEYLKAKR